MTTSPTQFVVPKVLIIDDDLRAARNAGSFFQQALGDIQVEFVIQGPDDVGDESQFVSLVEALQASAVLVDQRLGERSSAPFTGLELASSLRSARPSLPIFILTKWAKADQLEEQGFVVDDVMDKAVLRTSAASYVGRLLRAIGRYDEARSSQSKRMQHLVAESLSRELTDEEAAELIRLRAEAGINRLGHEVELSAKVHDRLERKQDILDALKRLVEED